TYREIASRIAAWNYAYGLDAGWRKREGPLSSQPGALKLGTAPGRRQVGGRQRTAVGCRQLGRRLCLGWGGSTDWFAPRGWLRRCAFVLAAAGAYKINGHAGAELGLLEKGCPKLRCHGARLWVALAEGC